MLKGYAKILNFSHVKSLKISAYEIIRSSFTGAFVYNYTDM